MKYRELQQELKKHRDAGHKLVQGFRLNQRATILQAKYVEILNESRESLGFAKYEVHEIFPIKPLPEPKITLAQLKERVRKEVAGDGHVSNPQLKSYFETITYHFQADHKDFKLDFTSRATWLLLQQYTTKMKLSHMKVTHPEEFKVHDLVAKVRNDHKFSYEMNLKSA
ncbi:hypothetical protein HW132_28255 [Brasilonema sp. CT11]|nr:hypothetical protein [Brasilonema sp. CT11]